MFAGGTYGVGIVLGQSVAEIAADAFAILELDLLRVKGKSEPEHIFGLFGDAELAGDPAFSALRTLQDQFHTEYRAQNWAAAGDVLTQIVSRAAELQINLGTFAAVFEDRIQEFGTVPPAPDWDGVHVATSK